MSTAQLKATERFLQAMGTMVADEDKVAEVVCFINSLKQRETLPLMSAAEVEKYIPLEQAFDNLRKKAQKYYDFQSV